MGAEWIVPLSGVLIVFWATLRGVPVFEEFCLGAKEGLSAAARLMPALCALVIGVRMLSASGAIDLLSGLLAPVCSLIGFPSEAVPLFLLRPFSGSGSLALLQELFRRFSPDSAVGRLSSILMGSSETTFYATTVYFGAVGKHKTRYALPAAILSDLAAAGFSLLALRLFFG